MKFSLLKTEFEETVPEMNMMVIPEDRIWC